MIHKIEELLNINNKKQKQRGSNDRGREEEGHKGIKREVER